MMKSLLVFFASLMMLSASAQLRSSEVLAPRQPLTPVRVHPQVQEMEMQRRAPGTAAASLKNTAPVRPYYRRPAGAFYSHFVAVNGEGGYSYMRDFVLMKPYCDYTYYGIAPEAGESDTLVWDYWQWDNYYQQVGSELTVKYFMEVNETPIFYVYQPDIQVDDYFQYPYYFSTYHDGLPVVSNKLSALVYAVPNPQVVGHAEGEELLLSSKTMCTGGRDGSVNAMFVTYNNAVPFGPNTYGRWFGKNGGHYDGMAQAFEEPEHPYLLNKVCIDMGSVDCRSTVNLTCKVYRIDDIPAYRDDESVTLSQDSWELIATGRATMKPSDEISELVTFELYGHDDDDPSLEYEITPTIDYPILVVFEGYNNPECDGLLDFTCFVSADIHADEGFGELAYLKCPINDEAGNFTGQYEWKGLNNFFASGEMKTGYSIFIVAEQPYLTFYCDDDGEYVFPPEGGLMEKPIHDYQYDDDEVIPSIVFWSWTPSVDDGWMITCNGDDPPEWLEIELYDGVEGGEFDGRVMALVTAEPLPQGIQYREAVVRFEIPGAYLDYKFMQGEKIGPIDPPCICRNGECTVADVNHLINLILEDMYDNCADVNKDGELNIADINALIDYILEH